MTAQNAFVTFPSAAEKWILSKKTNKKEKSLAKTKPIQNYCVFLPHEKNRKHKGHEKLHEESVGLEALEERGDGAVLRRRRVWKQMCNATYPFVRSVLHGVQRHLSNCRKRIARCAKVPCKLSEARCKLQKSLSLCSESRN